MRYIDSASRLLADTVYDWLRPLLSSATTFACQSGYYRYDALAPFEVDIRNMLDQGGRFDLVIGANEDRLSAPDLEQTLSMLSAHMSGGASFTLVGAKNALFHPKTYYLELASGVRHAAIGSGNLTIPGIGHHIEACLLLDDSVDDPATLDAVRDAILAWPLKAAAGAGDARPITDQYIRDLQAERIIDPAPVPVSGSRSRSGTTTGQSSFPAIQSIPGVPQRRGAPRPRATPAPGHLPGATAAFPVGVVGVAKRLSRTDVKGFVGGAGTPYIALPPSTTDLADKLPMRPYGTHGEPRLDVVIEARLNTAPADVVFSGTDPANITHVGMGTTHGSNVDLRFNIQHGVVAGLVYVATLRGVALPHEGDVVAIEFLNGAREIRMTYATADPLKSTLLGRLIAGRSWGWLPTGVVPVW